MTEFDDKSVYILDSYGLIFRSYFAFISRPLTYNGKNVSAIFGFFRNLHTILNHYKPKYIIAAFDSKTKTFRHELYSDYKANRPPTPEDLHAQVPIIEDILKTLGIPVLQCNGYEADDIIATIAKKCKELGRCCRILSGDKDLMQLVDKTTQILKPDHADVWKVTGVEGVKAEWGVEPVQLLDLLALYGDSADNIPGVKGIGVKTAGKLLNDYKNLEGIYSHIDEIKGAVQKKLSEGKENAFFSRKLVQLNDEVPCAEIDLLINSEPKELHFIEAAAKLNEEGIPSVAKQFASFGLGGTKSSGLKKDDTTNVSAEIQLLKEEIMTKKNSGNYKAVMQISELNDFVEAAISQKEKTIAFDLETDSLDTLNAKITGFSLSYKKGEAVYVPLFTSNLFDSMSFISKEDALSAVSRIFDSPDVIVVFHNAKFDIKVLITNSIRLKNGKIQCKIADTMIAAWLLNPDRLGKNSYSLEYLAENILGLSGIEYTDIVKKDMTFADVPLEKAVPYAAEDADFTLQLWNKLKPELEANNLFGLYQDIEMKLLPLLSDMEREGIHLEEKILTEYNKELTEQINKTQSEIFKTVGHEFNIASPLQLQQVLFEERKLKPGKKTKRGYSTDTSVLEELSLYDEVPKLILEYRELSKLQSTYVDTLPKLCDSNGRIHTDFIQTGTATGRLSSREPNLQNIPVKSDAGRKIRSAFTAESGKVLISADYSQIELAILAHLSQDENMCRAFIEGSDIHKSTAALIFNVNSDEVTSEMRRTAKTINFGVIYGMSSFRLANEIGISRTQAADFIENYFKTYSSVKKFMDKTIEKAEECGYVETIFGRKRKILNIASRNKMEKAAAERIAINTPIQGSAADIVKKAMLEVSQALSEKNNGAKLLLQVHDELILECPEDQDILNETLLILKEKMEGAVKLSVPLRVSVEYGKNWGQFH